jgi:hypothetical protein
MPWTRGCIGMRNGDVIELFSKIASGSPVLIREKYKIVLGFINIGLEYFISK